MEHEKRTLYGLCDIQIGEVWVKWERKLGLVIEKYRIMPIV
jgi:hypothetical protein